MSLGPGIPALCPFLWLGYWEVVASNCKKQLEAYPTPRPCSQRSGLLGIRDTFCHESVVSGLQECFPHTHLWSGPEEGGPLCTH